MTKLVLGLQSVSHLCSTVKEREKMKNKLLLVSIREEFRTDSMATIR